MHEFAVNQKGDVLLIAETALSEPPTRAAIEDSYLHLYAEDRPIHSAEGVPADLVEKTGKHPQLLVVECPGNKISRETLVSLAT